MKLTLGRLLLLLLVIGTAVAGILSLNPKPVLVDATPVERGHLEVTVDEDGKTRVRDRYIVSAPLNGKLRRIGLRVGNQVVLGETILAIIDPSDPALLDPRQRAMAEARVKAAGSAVEQTEAQVRERKANLELARLELDRIQKLHDSGGSTKRELDAANNHFRSETEQLASIEFGLKIARYELEQAQAALLHAEAGKPSPDTVRYDVVSPINGRVLKVLQESAAVVQPGTPLLELGDTTDLELEIDVLSTDAVKIQPGARVFIEHWGGSTPLEGYVHLVEPSGFTKISALGVEEQRVNVIARFEEPIERREALGDGFRIEARIVVWEADDVLKIPTSALFRDGEQWAVFVIENELAQQRHIKIGQRNRLEVEVQEGLSAGQLVIEHPADRIGPGTKVQPRKLPASVPIVE